MHITRFPSTLVGRRLTVNGSLRGLSRLSQLSAYPALSSFTARFPIIWVRLPIVLLLWSSYVFVTDGCFSAPPPSRNGLTSVLECRTVRWVCRDNSASNRPRPLSVFLLNSSLSRLNAGYGLSNVSTWGS